MKTFMFIVVFLLIGAFFIIANQNIKLNSSENVSLFFNEYAGWWGDLLDNGRAVIGYVVKMGWLPDGGELSPN